MEDIKLREASILTTGMQEQEGDPPDPIIDKYKPTSKEELKINVELGTRLT